MRRVTQRKQMTPIVVNGSIHTAYKQHQRKNVPICVRVASHVLCELGLMEHTAVNRSVHTGWKQLQRVFTQTCTQICLCVLCEWGLNPLKVVGFNSKHK